VTGLNRLSPALGSLVFFVVAPGVVAGAIPWWLTRWEVGGVAMPLRILGVMIAAGGVTALLYSFVRFVVEGIGTPAPVAPTRQLVVGGLYRYVRNPMYLAVLATILGEALLFGRPVLLVYSVISGTAMVAFARLYEEPVLARRFGKSYEAYKRNVPGWWPRLTPWRDDAPSSER
jgi:protein-S-isoprenylcysteine O-methyltransferase Ste14